MKHEELRKWQCPECDAFTLQKDLLQAPNPFDPAETVMGCPHCKSIADFIEICDEPGCKQRAGCGFPTGNDGDQWGGYRRTCYQHSPYIKKGN